MLDPEKPETYPLCLLCGKKLTAWGELQDLVCAGRPGEDIARSCTIRLQQWMETGVFAGAFEKERAPGRPDWVKQSWAVAIDYWQERGGLPPLE